ncbi:MAG: hypothetical protein K8U57_34025 [Planctomycetes bacterium]|nr:hypothetical protein [Planctomycetota bacterium]
MRRYGSAFLALVVISCASKNEGDKSATHTIKLKGDPALGKSLTIKSASTMEFTILVKGPDGKVHERKQHEQDVNVYTLTALAVEGDKATKYKRVYDKAEKLNDGVLIPFPYQGRTVVYTHKDGKWDLTGEGNPPLSQHDIAHLIKNANHKHHLQNKDFEPLGPVKIGETWKLDVKKVGQGFGPELDDLDLEKCHAEGKLVKVFDKDGAKFGVMEFTINLAVKRMKEITFETPMSFEITVTLDTAIDASTSAGKMTMKGTMKGNGVMGPQEKKIQLEMNANLKGDEEQSAEQ